MRLGRDRITDMLIKHGADVNAIDSVEEETPLIIAAHLGNFKLKFNKHIFVV